MTPDSFRGLPPGSELTVAFSGGVDSSVAAYLCKQAGYRVRAVAMSMLGEEQFNREKVAAAAERLEIPLDILELSHDFESCVMRYAWNEYRNGRTPNPCAVCNPVFKFGRLIDFAKRHGCAGFVTGHYARILHAPDGSPRLLRGTSLQKDQSYFLFGLSRGQLSYSYFPLGNLEKPQVREIARSLGLPNADAPESQDACFVPRGGTSLGEMLRMKFQEDSPEGNFISTDGKILGRHTGIHSYTIGQRKGTGVAMGRPAYVKSIDAISGNVVLATDPSELLTDAAMLADPNWIRGEYAEKESFECEVKIRYRSRSVKGRVSRIDGRTLCLRFDDPQRAVTPGQAAVFYKGDEVIGGAWIQPDFNR